MSRRIRIEIGGTSGTAELCESLSPVTCDAFWASLPIDTVLASTVWSGEACCFPLESEALQAVTENEAPVCSIYPGYLATRPASGEALIAYGTSEYRSPLGTEYATRVARITEGLGGIRQVLARTREEGEARVRITRLA